MPTQTAVTLKQLRALQAVAELGTISAAAYPEGGEGRVSVP